MPRIAAGLLRGLSLHVPPTIRATEDKVRQALFNILGSRVAEARVIDGFAGSGALGIEALSRGARFVVFLESRPACVQAIRQNLARIAPGAIPGRGEVRQGDALRQVRRLAHPPAGRPEPFDLLLFDPPYEGEWGKKTLNVVAECGILAPAGLLCIEHARQRQLPARVGPLGLLKQHRYGDTVLSFYSA